MLQQLCSQSARPATHRPSQPRTLCCLCHLVAGHPSPTGPQPPICRLTELPGLGGLGETKAESPVEGQELVRPSLSGSPWFSPGHGHQEKLPPASSGHCNPTAGSG